MKKILYVLIATVLSLAVMGCNKEEEPAVDQGIVGSWSILSWNGASAVSFNIYLQFHQDGTFTMYHNMDNPFFDRFTGTYSVVDGVISGIYRDGTLWNSSYYYELSSSGNSLTMTDVDTEDASVYVRSEVPEDVAASASVKSHITSAGYIL